MTTSAISEKLVSYLKIADDEKVKAIYTMVADEINTEENDWDEDFINGLKKRTKNASSGKSKTYSWEETKKAGINKVKSKLK